MPATRPRSLPLVLLALVAAPAVAAADDRARGAQTLDASIGYAQDRGTAAVSWNWLFDVLPGRLEVGFGARLTTFRASGSLVFRTGDPDLIRDDRVRRLVVQDPWVTSLNGQLLAVVRIVGPLEAGADIDLVGFSFGPSRIGDYEAADPIFAGPQKARVSSFDLLLIDIRDRGQLNSEYFLGLRLGAAWTLRAGLSHVATEYRTVEPLDDGNRRFRRFTTQVFVGVSRRLR